MLSAIARSEAGKPLLELAAEEFIFELKIEQDGHELPARFHMRPYHQQDLIALLRDLSPSFRMKGRTLITDAGNRAACLPFFDNHFIRMSGGVINEQGQDPTLEEQIAWLAIARNVRVRAVLEGYGGLRIPEPELNGGPPKLVIGADHAGHKVRTEFELFDPEEEELETLLLQHSLRPETDQDFSHYLHATGQSERSLRRQDFRVIEDHKAIVELYDAMCNSLAGAVLRGKPCVQDNRDAWLPLVPYWHKNAVVDEVFRGVLRKNS